MKLPPKQILTVLLIFFFLKIGNAAHIIGGEMFYDCLGGGSFKITLKLYRDCAGPGALFDNLATVSVFNTSNGNWIQDLQIPIPPEGTFFIPTDSVNSCYLLPTSLSLCIEGVVYERTVTLPPLPQGYTLSYQRCCRNPSIVNIQNPMGAGSTYTVQIPASAWTSCNSSPRFNIFPPVVLCGSQPFTFDHSATDPDGDLLVYSMCTPYDGGTFANPMPVPAAAPPYGFVVYNTPNYTTAQPLSLATSLTLNSNSGLIAGTPAQLGQHVLAVCVQEFRNGVLLSENKRDFQFNVIAGCTAVPPTLSSFRLDALPSVGLNKYCNGTLVPFYYYEINPSTIIPEVYTGPPHLAVYQTFLWDFGVPGMISDTSDEMHPNFNYPNVGEYTVTLTGNPYSSCPSQYSFDISIHQKVNLDILADTFAMCINGNSFNFQADGNINEDSTFHWFFENNTDTLESFVKNPQNISWNSTGMHIVSLVMEDAFCRDSTSDTIYVDPELDIGFISNSNPLCTNTPGDFEIDEAASAYSNGATFIWDFGDGDSARSKTASHLFDVPGIYTVELTVNNPNGCPDTITFPFPDTITVNPSPTAELLSDTTTATMFNPVIQFSDLSLGALLTDFDPGDGSSFNSGAITYTYGSAGDYWAVLTVENTFGCKDADSLKISIEPYFSLFIPNAFSPDGDGINDFFGPVGGGINQFLFRVYDRWGHLIFESDSIDKQWDGTVNGGKTIAKQDVYSYTLDIVDFQRQQSNYKGRITLLR